MWTKDELKVKKYGYVDLASAIIKQWNIDGRPRGDKDGVLLWAQLIQAHSSQMHNGSIKHASTDTLKHVKH
jgi:hypothetical protein